MIFFSLTVILKIIRYYVIRIYNVETVNIWRNKTVFLIYSDMLFSYFSFLAAITLRRNGRRASFCSQVPSFPPTPRLASPMLQVHSGHHVRPSRYGSTTREWHSPDDRDEEIAHQLRLWRFLVNPESGCSHNANKNINNNDNNSTTWEASDTTTEAFSTQKLCCRTLRS